jgi:hypothetical protein
MPEVDSRLEEGFHCEVFPHGGWPGFFRRGCWRWRYSDWSRAGYFRCGSGSYSGWRWAGCLRCGSGRYSGWGWGWCGFFCHEGWGWCGVFRCWHCRLLLGLYH